MEEIALLNHRAMIEIPENTVALVLNAKVFHNGELIDVERVFSLAEIREMFRKADDGYIDDDDRFMITDKGLAWLEEHKTEM